MARMNKDDIGRYFDHGIYLPTKTIDVGDGDFGIDEITAAKVCKGLHILDGMSPDKPITIRMNSVGGDIYHGLAIFDAIKECTSEVNIKVYGQAMSMAAWILQAGDHRVVHKNCRIMIHVGSAFLADHSENVKRWAKQFEKDEIIFQDILLERIREKHPKFTRRKIRDMLLFDTVLMPQEAVDLGLADEVGGDE